MRQKNFLSVIILNVILPLMIGLIVYLLFRPQTKLTVFILGHENRISGKINSTSFQRLVDVAPDFCWDYSLASAIFIIDIIYFRVRLILPTVLLVIVGAEFIQIFYPANFTFDWLDVIAAAAAVWSSYILIHKKKLWPVAKRV